jgi:hypothetical protein
MAGLVPANHLFMAPGNSIESRSLDDRTSQWLSIPTLPASLLGSRLRKTDTEDRIHAVRASVCHTGTAISGA